LVVVKIYLPADLPAKIAKLSPEAQVVAKRLVRAKLRRLRRAATSTPKDPEGTAQILRFEKK
jgi:hypothetical protein